MEVGPSLSRKLWNLPTEIKAISRQSDMFPNDVYVNVVVSYVC